MCIRDRGTPDDKMTLREIYDEMWELDARCNKEENIGTTHEKGDNNVERMTEEDWERWDDNEAQMKNKRTRVYAQVTEQYTQEEYEQWRRVIRQPENPIQTENTELREWIRVMFELSREDMCNWRKEHNQIEEFIGMPHHKTLEQSNMQLEIEIVKVKQQKKMPKPTQKEASRKPTCQEVMNFMAEQVRKLEEDNQRHHEELRKIMDEGFRKLDKRMDRCLKNMNETLDSTSEGIKASPNTEEHIKKIRKIGRKKILNTKEELEMRKGGLINAFNIPINERRELSKSMNYRKNFIKMAKVNHHKIIKKNLNRFKYYLNIATVEEYVTISAIFLKRNISAERWVNNTEERGNGMLLKMREYVMSEEVQYLLVREELTMTEDPYLNEGFTAEKWESRMVRRLSRRELITNTPVIREHGVPELMDHGLSLIHISLNILC